MSRYKSILLISCFALCIFFPLVDQLVNISPEPKSTENKNKASFPNLSIKRLDPYPVEFRTWLNSNLKARGHLMSWYQYFKSDILNTQAFPDRVIEGKDGWMYWVEKALEDYRGTNRFSKTELVQLENELARRANWCRSRGMQYYVVIIPNKHAVYPEFLPDNIIQLHPQSRREQLMEIAGNSSAINAIDLCPNLMIAKAKHPVYYKTDTHWNEFGAFTGYSAIMNDLKTHAFKSKLFGISDYDLSYSSVKGMGLAKMLGNENIVQEYSPFLKPKESYYVFADKRGYLPPKDFEYPDEYEIRLKTEDTDLPKLFLVRDSFSNDLLKFLGGSFRETIAIWDDWKYQLNEDLIIKEQPDIVMTVIIERHLDRLIKQNYLEKFNLE